MADLSQLANLMAINQNYLGTPQMPTFVIPTAPAEKPAASLEDWATVAGTGMLIGRALATGDVVSAVGAGLVTYATSPQPFINVTNDFGAAMNMYHQAATSPSFFGAFGLN